MADEGFTWPESWKNDVDNPGSNKHFIADWAKYEKEYDKLGVRSHRVIKDEHGKLKIQPYDMAPLAAAAYANTKHEVGIEFLTMTRTVRGDEQKHPDSTILGQMKGGIRVEVEMIHVPRAEVAGFEAQGWEIKYAPASVIDYSMSPRDTRPKLPRPVDVITTDKPVTDSARYLTRGGEIVSRAWTDGKWKPGDLLGKGGSLPEVKAQSASYADPKDWNKVSDDRSATSTGHIFHMERPRGVSLGWGGYDQFTTWQSHGRQIHPDMVEKKEWSKDRLEPIEFVNEAGEVVETVPAILEPDELPPLPFEPVTLYERLHPDETKDRKP